MKYPEDPVAAIRYLPEYPEGVTLSAGLTESVRLSRFRVRFLPQAHRGFLRCRDSGNLHKANHRGRFPRPVGCGPPLVSILLQEHPGSFQRTDPFLPIRANASRGGDAMPRVIRQGLTAGLPDRETGRATWELVVFRVMRATVPRRILLLVVCAAALLPAGRGFAQSASST